MGIVLIILCLRFKSNLNTLQKIEKTIDIDIANEYYSEEETINKNIVKNISCRIVKAEEGKMEVELSAPDISKDLLEWTNQISDIEYTDEKFEEKVIELLNKSERQKSKFVLQYTQNSNEWNIEYTPDFIIKSSCGLYEFYYMITDQLLDELIEEMEE